MNAIERRQLREDGWEDWSMTFHKPLRVLWPLVQMRVLMPADVCVAAYYLSYMEVGTSMVEVTTSQAAQDLGMLVPNVSGSLKRLRTAGAMVKGKRGTGYVWMLNPSLIHAGGAPKMQKRQAQWDRMVEEAR